ncbi:MAG: VOC family protein [Candidatus Bathyarchaeota archaeon]|nr:MAG: VOC family protein [Candidatus Bathyarchaeota archaeon]
MSGFDRMYTFIYHRDLETADRFYGKLLGLEMEPESDWVIYYRVRTGVTIGVVEDGRGYLRATEDKPVILCLGVPDDGDIGEIYDRLKGAGVRMFTSEVELREAEECVFFCKDPEGYVVEIVKRPRERQPSS